MIKYVACFTGHRPFGLPWGFDESKENCLRFKRDLFEILKMVQHSNICIACWNNKRSGTYNTIKFAKENGLKLKIINTENYR